MDRFVNVIKPGGVYKSDRAPLKGIAGRVEATLMLIDPAFAVICHACVIAAIGAADDIDIVIIHVITMQLASFRYKRTLTIKITSLLFYGFQIIYLAFCLAVERTQI